MSIFKGKSNIRTVASVTSNNKKQLPEYRAFQIFQKIVFIWLNLEFGSTGGMDEVFKECFTIKR